MVDLDCFTHFKELTSKLFTFLEVIFINVFADNFHDLLLSLEVFIEIKTFVKGFFTLISWLNNEPTNVGSLLFATNYWMSVLMHG